MSILVIHGADFSTNKIPTATIETGWFLTNYTDYSSYATRLANLANGGWGLSSADMSPIQGKYINTIKFKVSAAGDFPVLKGSTYGGVSIVRELSLSAGDVGNVVTLTFDRIYVGISDIIAFGKPNGGGFYFGNLSGKSFYSKVPTSPTNNVALIFPIDIGYFEETQ